MRRATLLFALALFTAGVHAAPPLYRSAEAVAVAPDGQRIYAADRTASRLVAFSHDGTRAYDAPLPDEPCGLAVSADGARVYVACRRGGCVAEVAAASGRVLRRLPAGAWPMAVVLAPTNDRLYVCNRGERSVGVVDLASGKSIATMPVGREPVAAAVSADGRRLIVSNLLPDGAGTDPKMAAELSLLDLDALRPMAAVRLPPGATVVRGVAIDPSGDTAYVVYTLGRFNLPITQLERGWVHTYALSIVDLREGTLRTTLLLDDMTGGAADPHGVAFSRDGRRLYIGHSGIHQVSILDVERLDALLAGNVPQDVAAMKEANRDNVWVRLAKDRAVADELMNDLTALYIGGVIRRVPSGGNGPRGIAVASDGRVYAANYFAGSLGVLDAEGKLLAAWPLGAQPTADAARRGETYFHDAHRCFQHWHSCATCHPDGRVDGLPWDFMRDGLGNGKDVVSLVGMNLTPPHNRRATRSDPRECMETGVTGSHLIVPAAADVDDLVAYAGGLAAEPNPTPPPAAAVARGKALFERAGCGECHPAPLYTDLRSHHVGILTPGEHDGKYDTPSLVEVYRTAPYMHDGRAADLAAVLGVHNAAGLHGKTADLSPAEIADLVAFLLSL